MFPGAGPVFDSSTQRLFAFDGFSNRILVFPASPEQLARWPAASPTDTQGATVVIGQPDFTSTEIPRKTGITPRRFSRMGSRAIDEEGQRIFVADRPGNRILVFDIHPDRLKNDPEAIAVIGQPDFMSKSPGIGPAKFAGISGMTYDPDLKRLFVSDRGNNRVLVFNADPNDPDALKEAIAVMGQKDFMSKSPRSSRDQILPGPLGYDWRYHRLFVTESLNHRIMVFDGRPDHVSGDARAIAVIGQTDAESIHPAVSQNRVAMPRLNVDPFNQKLYVSEGYPGGNRIVIFDISPENLKTGMAAVDVVGHSTPSGEADFDNRMAQGHLDGQSLAAARSIEIDTVDHRLFIGDEYNHRVVVYQLDELNRINEHSAKWVLGQPDLESSFMGLPSARNMTVPLAVAYDKASKRLFVGDGYHNRVLVYEAAPDKLESGMAASWVIGQKDFQSTELTAGKAGLNFEVRMGRGIASTFLPLGLAVDEQGQRLFVSDGRNNRVVVHDIRRNVLQNGAEAIGVLGQTDFNNTQPNAGKNGMFDPGHLVFDPAHQRLFVIDYQNRRVLVFNVEKGQFTNGMPAINVIGQESFDAKPVRHTRSMPVDGKHIYSPNGIAFDSAQQLLYVSDGGGTYNNIADRVLVFDVDPKRLENGPQALAAVGAPDLNAPAPGTFGGPESYPGQFTIRDTRGITLDPENGRLFTTGSFESRVVAFNFPRASWKYLVGAEAMQSFGTLDAVDLGSQQDTLSVSTATATSSRVSPEGVVHYSITEQTVDPRTQRHSRRLISEAAVSASTPTREATLSLPGSDNRTYLVSLYNPGRRNSTVTLSMLDQTGMIQREWKERVNSQQQLVIEPQGMTEVSSLKIESNRPIAIVALRKTNNNRGDTLLSPVPMATQEDPNRQKIVPLFTNGGMTKSELVLINSTDKILRGNITFFDKQGQQHNLGTASDYMAYYLPPYSTQVIPSDGAGPRSADGFVLVGSSNDENAPYAAVRTSRRYGDVWASEGLVEGLRGKDMKYAIDHRPNPVRHGEIDTRLVVVNPSNDTVRVRILLGTDEIISRTVQGREQMIMDLGEAVPDMAQGILRVMSEQEIVVSALQRTLNIRGEMIESGLPKIQAATLYPYVINGEGFSTEIRLANTTAQEMTGQLEFHLPDGQAASETILR